MVAEQLPPIAISIAYGRGLETWVVGATSGGGGDFIVGYQVIPFDPQPGDTITSIEVGGVAQRHSVTGWEWDGPLPIRRRIHTKRTS